MNTIYLTETSTLSKPIIIALKFFNKQYLLYLQFMKYIIKIYVADSSFCINYILKFKLIHGSIMYNISEQIYRISF